MAAKGLLKKLKPIWYVIVFATFVWWTIWRWMLLSGSIHKVGEPCTGLIHCRDGPCLIHARDEKGALATGPGYCSHGCNSDKDCPTGTRCEPRPAEISRANGDHLPFIKVPDKLCIKHK